MNPTTIIFTESEIQSTIERLSWEITSWLQSSSAKGLNLISVLEGAKPFARDLMECLDAFKPDLDVRVHEVRVQGTNGTTLLKERKKTGSFPSAADLLTGPILIVDDLVDSGLTLQMLREELDLLQPGMVKTAVLIRKFGTASGPVDFCGFELDLSKETLSKKGLKDYWLFGYGMDLDGAQRELKHIGWVEIK